MPVVDMNADIRSGFTDMASRQPVTRKPSSELSPDDFMTLFLAQVKHPNPMQPMDSAATLQQMSAMSAIKSQEKMQQTLQDLEKNINYTMGNTQVLQASTLIGKNIVYATQPQTSPLVKDVGMSGSVLVPQKASNVTLSITDPKTNKIIQTISLGDAGGAGAMDYKWDGKIGNANADPGYYKISATATIDGKVTPIAAAGTFKVNSVTFDDSGLVMNLEGYGGVHMDDHFIKIV